VLLAISVTPVQAGVGWCKSDPVVQIDGQLADIFVSAPPEAPLVVTGPTQIVVTHPVDVDAALILSDLGFGKGEEVTFVASRSLRVRDHTIPLRIAVYVPAADNGLPVKVEFASGLSGLLSPSSANGTANAWVILATDL
jgi:hypothetical protein